tara:strand:- start:90 stop:419 length:330 start_codon:yes stop_codon:yes gene_type:complete
MTSAIKVIDQELAQFGWMDSIATNSITDFKSPNLNLFEGDSGLRNSDFIEIFIIYIIFYVIFCTSLFLYIVFDLGLAFFIQSQFTNLTKFIRSQISDSLPLPFPFHVKH